MDRKRKQKEVIKEEDGEEGMTPPSLKKASQTTTTTMTTAEKATSKSAKKKKTTVVKLRRQGGRVIQDCDVYIGRNCNRGGWNLPKSKWANPFSLKACGGNIQEVVRRYENHVRSRPDLMEALPELRGKRLGCWCKVTPTTPCHGDVLVRLLEELSDD
eukprot:TRINITY_DN9802_c0_g2_i1.p2 TRINITY_DN9802_c0_g2~~TRINITY_DN9802_c0_g2_i1.p2  ORF type:complete len:158 (+),score=36.22 TRINITY_DN9802_c0_g2_i1:206-679(+)